MADIITIILQGIDNVSGVADRAATNMERSVRRMKREMEDTERATHLQHTIDDLRNAMDPSPAHDLQVAYEKLKGSMSDVEAVRSFQDHVEHLRPSIDADTESVKRFHTANNDLGSSLQRHIERLHDYDHQLRLSRGELGAMARESEQLGDRIEQLTRQTERLAETLPTKQAKEFRGEVDRLLQSTGNDRDFERFIQRLESVAPRSKASKDAQTQFRNALARTRDEAGWLQRDLARMSKEEERAAEITKVHSQGMEVTVVRSRSLGQEMEALGHRIERVNAAIERMSLGMNRVPAQRLQSQLSELLQGAGRPEDFEIFEQQLSQYGPRKNISKANLTEYEQGLRDLRFEMERLQVDMRGMTREVSESDDEIGALASRLQGAADDADTLDKSVTGLTDHLDEHRTVVRETRTDHDALGRSLGETAEGLGDVGRAVRGASRDIGDGDHDVRNFITRVNNLETSIGNLRRSTINWARTFWETRVNMENLAGAGQRLSSQLLAGMERASRGFTSSFNTVNFLVLTAIGLFPVFTILVEGLAGAVTALGGGIMALASSLAYAAGVLVALPGMLLGLGGAIASVLTVLGPQVSGVIQGYQALKQMEAAQGESTASGRNPVADAEEQLRRVRRDNAWQERDQERALHDLRLQNKRQEIDAEKALASVRSSAAERLLSAEERLAALRKTNNETRAQLELNLAAARLGLANADNEIGRRMAQASVTEAEAQLRLFAVSPSMVSQHEAERNVAQIRKDNVQNIADAEERLRRVRADNARQEYNAEVRLHQLRVHNAEQLSDAQKRVKDAATGGASGVDAAKRAWDNLSPAQQRAAREIREIVKQWDTLTGPTKAKLFAFLDELLAKIKANMPAIQEDIGRFSDVLIKGARNAMSSFDDPTFLRAWRDDLKGAADQLDHTQAGINGLGRALVYLLHGAQPFLDWLSGLVEKLGKWAENTAKVNDENGKFARFFERTRETLTIMGHIARNLGITLGHIFAVGFAPGEDSLLGSFEKLTAKWAAWSGTDEGKRSIAKFLRDSAESARALLGFLLDIIRAIGRLGQGSITPKPLQPGEFGGERSAVQRGWQPDSGFNRAMEDFGRDVRHFADWIETFNEKHRQEVAKFWHELGNLVGAFVRLLDAVQPVVDLFFWFFNRVLAPALSSRLFQDLAIGVFAVAAAFGALNLAMALLAADPVFWVVAAIVLLIAGLVEAVRLIIKHWDDISAAFSKGAKACVGFLNDLWEGVKRIVGWVVDFFRDHWKEVIPVLIAGPFGLAGVFIARHFGDIKSTISGWVQDIIGFFTTTLPNGITGALGAVGRAFGSIASTAWDKIKGLKDDVLGAFNSITDFFTKVLPNRTTAAAEAVSKFFESIRDAAIKWIKEIFDKVGGVFKAVGKTLEKIPGAKSAGHGLVEAWNWVFDKGGEIGGMALGAAVPIVAHVGEWVLNTEQQRRLASVFGSVLEAKRFLFGGGAPSTGGTFANGGVITMAALAGLSDEEKRNKILDALAHGLIRLSVALDLLRRNKLVDDRTDPIVGYDPGTRTFATQHGQALDAFARKTRATIGFDIPAPLLNVLTLGYAQDPEAFKAYWRAAGQSLDPRTREGIVTLVGMMVPVGPKGTRVRVAHGDALRKMRTMVDDLVRDDPKGARESFGAMVELYRANVQPVANQLRQDLVQAGVQMADIHVSMRERDFENLMNESARRVGLSEVDMRALGMSEEYHAPAFSVVVGGRDGPSFTAIRREGKWETDDMPEFNDPEVFGSRDEALKFYGAVERFRGTNLEGQTVLYRAMSLKEYDAWKKGEAIPVGKWFARSEGTAMSRASDITGEFPRAHRFVVARKDVVEVDPGSFQLINPARLSGDRLQTGPYHFQPSGELKGKMPKQDEVEQHPFDGWAAFLVDPETRRFFIGPPGSMHAQLQNKLVDQGLSTADVGRWMQGRVRFDRGDIVQTLLYSDEDTFSGMFFTGAENFEGLRRFAEREARRVYAQPLTVGRRLAQMQHDPLGNVVSMFKVPSERDVADVPSMAHFAVYAKADGSEVYVGLPGQPQYDLQFRLEDVKGWTLRGIQNQWHVGEGTFDIKTGRVHGVSLVTRAANPGKGALTDREIETAMLNAATKRYRVRAPAARPGASAELQKARRRYPLEVPAPDIHSSMGGRPVETPQRGTALVNRATGEVLVGRPDEGHAEIARMMGLDLANFKQDWMEVEWRWGSKGEINGLQITDLWPKVFKVRDSGLDAGIRREVGEAYGVGGAGLQAVARMVAALTKKGTASVSDVQKVISRLDQLPETGMLASSIENLRKRLLEMLAKAAQGKHFALGGIVDGIVGTAVPILAHAGEWVLNRDQQMRLARALGGWDVAREYLFQTPVLRPKIEYAGGGIVQPAIRERAALPDITQSFQITTASPDVDIDYVMRIASARLAGALVPEG